MRARVEHSIGIIKRVFGFAKVRYRGLKKNAHRLLATCALANLFIARRHLLRSQRRSVGGLASIRQARTTPPAPPKRSITPTIATKKISMPRTRAPPHVQAFLNLQKSRPRFGSIAIPARERPACHVN